MCYSKKLIINIVCYLVCILFSMIEISFAFNEESVTLQNLSDSSCSGSASASGPKKTRSNSIRSDLSKYHTRGQSSASVVIPQPEQNNRNVNLRAMDCPSTFIRDGVYIWCDPDGLWTMLWKTKEKKDLVATLSSNTPIEVRAASKAFQIKSNSENNILEISNDLSPNKSIIQFASDDDSIKFDILIDGKVTIENVYIGSLLETPKQFPLILAKNPIKLINDTNTIDTGKNDVSFSQGSSKKQ